MQGGFVALPYDKTLSIQVHETWPGVPGPSCLGLWTGDQEPRSTDSRAPIHVSAFSVTCAQVALDSFARAAVRGPTAGGYCAQSLKLRFRFMDRGPQS